MEVINLTSLCRVTSDGDGVVTVVECCPARVRAHVALMKSHFVDQQGTQ